MKLLRNIFLFLLVFILLYAHTLFANPNFAVTKIQVVTEDGQSFEYDPHGKRPWLNFRRLETNNELIKLNLSVTIKKIGGAPLPKSLDLYTSNENKAKNIKDVIRKMADPALSDDELDKVVDDYISIIQNSDTKKTGITEFNTLLDTVYIAGLKNRKGAFQDATTATYEMILKIDPSQKNINWFFRTTAKKGRPSEFVRVFLDQGLRGNPRQIYVFNVELTPKALSESMVYIVNPTSYARAVSSKRSATPKKRFNREKINEILNRVRSDPDTVFNEDEVFETYYLKGPNDSYLRLLSPEELADELIEELKKSNREGGPKKMVHILPNYFENDATRLSQDLEQSINVKMKNGRIIKILIGSPTKSGKNGDGVEYSALIKGEEFPYEVTSNRIADIQLPEAEGGFVLNGNESMKEAIAKLKEAGIPVIIDFPFTHVGATRYNPELGKFQRAADALLKKFGYIRAIDDNNKKNEPLDYLNGKLKRLKDGEIVSAFTEFFCRSAYFGNITKDTIGTRYNEPPSSFREIESHPAGFSGLHGKKESQNPTQRQIRDTNLLARSYKILSDIHMIETLGIENIRADAIGESLGVKYEEAQYPIALQEIWRAFNPNSIFIGEVVGADPEYIANIARSLDAVQATSPHQFITEKGRYVPKENEKDEENKIYKETYDAANAIYLKFEALDTTGTRYYVGRSHDQLPALNPPRPNRNGHTEHTLGDPSLGIRGQNKSLIAEYYRNNFHKFGIPTITWADHFTKEDSDFMMKTTNGIASLMKRNPKHPEFDDARVALAFQIVREVLGPDAQEISMKFTSFDPETGQSKNNKPFAKGKLFYKGYFSKKTGRIIFLATNMSPDSTYEINVFMPGDFGAKIDELMAPESAITMPSKFYLLSGFDRNTLVHNSANKYLLKVKDLDMLREYVFEPNKPKRISLVMPENGVALFTTLTEEKAEEVNRKIVEALNPIYKGILPTTQNPNGYGCGKWTQRILSTLGSVTHHIPKSSKR